MVGELFWVTIGATVDVDVTAAGLIVGEEEDDDDGDFAFELLNCCVVVAEFNFVIEWWLHLLCELWL